MFQTATCRLSKPDLDPNVAVDNCSIVRIWSLTNESSSESVVSLDPAWPKISIAEANAALTAPGARFEMETVLVGGIATRVWKNAPHDLGALLDLSRTHGERLFTILDDERITYEANYREIGRAHV